MDGVRLVARSYADVITKFSRLDGLPIFLKNGASLRALHAKALLLKQIIKYAMECHFITYLLSRNCYFSRMLALLWNAP